jgi:hypothetical protein
VVDVCDNGKIADRLLPFPNIHFLPSCTWGRPNE